MTHVLEGELVTSGAIPPDDFHNHIERIREVADYELEVPENLRERLQAENSELVVDEDTVLAAATALQVGHLIIQGPPGTGKSSLARALSRAFGCSVYPTTAHEEWTTHDVIGHQTIHVDSAGTEQVVPVNGFFTEAVIRCAGAIVRHFDDPSANQATWLLIDELNRAHIDRAFGDLFAVLGSYEPVPVILGHHSEGNRELVTPRRFRIIATLNSIDKQFVNSLGQGLKRRFSFITLDIPPQRGPGEQWSDEPSRSSLAIKEFHVVVTQAVRRFARRHFNKDTQTAPEEKQKILQRSLLQNGYGALEALFSFIEKVRYATRDGAVPHLPVGTAHLVDVVDLFLEYVSVKSPNSFQEGFDPDVDVGKIMDWSVSLKLAPLFDSDTISPAALEAFADSLDPPFRHYTRRELLQTAAAGQFYVR